MFWLINLISSAVTAVRGQSRAIAARAASRSARSSDAATRSDAAGVGVEESEAPLCGGDHLDMTFHTAQSINRGQLRKDARARLLSFRYAAC
jgi:hypothetical protein